MKIDNYYIDEENVLHCFCGDMEDITISDVETDAEAQRLIDEENATRGFEPVEPQEEMEFPATFDEFCKQYAFYDEKEVYTNGSLLIPVFRVEQWLDHVMKG